MGLRNEQGKLWEPPKGRLVTIHRRYRVIRWNGWFYPARHLPPDSIEARVLEKPGDPWTLTITDVHGENAKDVHALSM
ncbi:MAG TPA: hypothetical protein VKA74_09830 [Myxococcota bacterium]|nr:hypothetical protein [Myxococcota bacterium]